MARRVLPTGLILPVDGETDHVWGRVRNAAKRIAAGASIEAYGVLHSYDPTVLSGALAIGMGAAAGLGGSGGGAAGRAADLVTDWGEKERRRYERLPHKVLVLADEQGVRLYRWPASGSGERVAQWPSGSYDAKKIRSFREQSVQVALPAGTVALLSGPTGVGRRQTARVVAAIIRHRAS